MEIMGGKSHGLEGERCEACERRWKASIERKMVAVLMYTLR